MIRGSASPAAAGGRRGGRAAGLLPASLVTAAAAAALFPSSFALGESSAERTRDQNVCFPVWGETALVKWYVDLGGGSLLFPILPGAGGIVLKGVCVNYPGPVTE